MPSSKSFRTGATQTRGARDDRVIRFALLTKHMLNHERAKWVEDDNVTLTDPPPRPDVPTALESAVHRAARRRFRAGGLREAPVYRFAMAVIRVIGNYLQTTSDWNPIMWQLSVYAFPKQVRIPPSRKGQRSYDQRGSESRGGVCGGCSGSDQLCGHNVCRVSRVQG